MDVTVVYESVFGTTRDLAHAIAEGVQAADPRARVSVLSVDDAAPHHIADTALLLVGGPTHGLGMTRPASRRAGREGKDAAVAGGATLTGVREWLATLPPAPPGAQAAAFTTRLPSPFAGSAARGVARGLRRAGYRVLGSEGFAVAGPTGPLRDGERDRARSWAAALTGEMAAQASG